MGSLTYRMLSRHYQVEQDYKVRMESLGVRLQLDIFRMMAQVVYPSSAVDLVQKTHSLFQETVQTYLDGSWKGDRELVKHQKAAEKQVKDRVEQQAKFLETLSEKKTYASLDDIMKSINKLSSRIQSSLEKTGGSV